MCVTLKRYMHCFEGSSALIAFCEFVEFVHKHNFVIKNVRINSTF